MKAMVLAAGVGSRLEPLTSVVPKPLVPIANIPVMEHIIDLLAKHGITEIIANLHYLPEQIKDYFKDGSDFGVKLQYIQEKELSGDAGGVRACRDFFAQDTFIVMMGDLVTDADLSKIIKEHKSKKAIATIALKKVKNVEHFGVAVQDKDGYIKGFQEKPQAKDALSDMASAGIYVLEPEVFDYIPAEGVYGFGRQLFPLLIEKSLPVYGSTIETYWSDVGTHDQYRQTNFDVLKDLVQMVQAPDSRATKEEMQKAEVWLEPGAQISPDAKIQPGSRILLGAGSVVESGARLAGAVITGSDCLIESGADVENTVLWSHCKVQKGQSLKDSIQCNDCRIEDHSKSAEVAALAGRSPQVVS